MARRGGIAALSLLLAVTATATPAAARREAWPNPHLVDPPPSQPEVLFTFDDGPDERHTGTILDILDKHGVKAVFFWVGYRVSGHIKHREERRRLVRRAAAEGHLIGNHTVNHAHLCSVSRAEAVEEIDENARIYRRLTRMPLIEFRAPYGDRCPRLEAMLAERHIHHHHWDIDPQEWEHYDSGYISRYVIGKLRNLEGRAVLLMHDTQLTSVHALPHILDWIEAENRRRTEVGLRPIRILSGSDWVEEHEDTSLYSWAADFGTEEAARMHEALRSLVPGPVRLARAPD